jgi:pimeloyl-ACP methyl ester carboxylesterase
MTRHVVLSLLLFFVTAFAHADDAAIEAKLDDIQQRLVGLSFPPSMVTNGAYWTEGDNLSPATPYRYFAKANANRIILFLHSWSGTMSQAPNDFPELAQMDRVAVVSPNFKGVNNSSAALGSDASIDEIKTVVDRVKYLTGIVTVDIIAFSGGTMAALNFMGKYPGVVRRASLFLPIYDLALLYSGTSDNSLRLDMVAGLGAAPVNADDPVYVDRSPRKRLDTSIGNTRVYLNAGLSDTVSPKIHGELAKAKLETFSPTATVIYREWNIGHAIGATERAEMVKQITQQQ